MNSFPLKIADEEQLDEMLSRPTAQAIEMFRRLDGDIIFLGIAGKIGPTLARMARRACNEAGLAKQIIGVSRFSSRHEREMIQSWDIETIQGDLLDKDLIKSLPQMKNVFFLTGMKFGSEDNLPMTWAVNSYIPGLIVEHFKDSRIAAFSTGCVYPLMTVDSGGSKESDPPGPVGEYAQSCLGRERMFEYGSRKNHTPVVLIRLNYAVELRYGLLVDIAVKVKNQQPIDLSMGYFNVIWQGDSNDLVLRSIEYAAHPPLILNITGGETLSVREVADQFGQLFGVVPILEGSESSTALLSNPEQAFRLLGKPTVSVMLVINWIAEWIRDGQKISGKPTHYEVRDGRY